MKTRPVKTTPAKSHGRGRRIRIRRRALIGRCLQRVRREPERTELWHIPEPLLEFAHGQMVEYPRDGLFLFGPCDSQKRPTVTRYGVIGTREGVERFRRFSAKMRGYIPIPVSGAS